MRVSLTRMFPVGGVEVMLLGAVVALVLCTALGWLLVRGGLGRCQAAVLAAFFWSLAVIALVTLIPTSGPPGIVPAEGRLAECSWDIGGPAPEGFWIFGGGQRALNTALFVPSGLLLVLAAARWGWWALALVPWGLLFLGCWSAGLELTQLALARLDRACDVTDIIDNVTGAGIGVLLGIGVTAAVRPWRWHRR